jgi:molecular chaperone DnaK
MGNTITIDKIFHAPQINEEELKTKTFVGIDFGTSTTVVSLACFNEGKIICTSIELSQLMKDGAEVESELLPSCIAYTLNGKRLVGQGAYELKGNPDYIFGENIWYSFKMELGKDLGPRWYRSSQDEIKSPQNATCIFFKYLKMMIEQYCKNNRLSSDIRYAVSIPASFESNQRRDLLDALCANNMLLQNQNLIDEPNAAFLGYITPDIYYKEPLELKEGINPKVLVFDFGAGTCDISILELRVDYSGLHTRNISISQFSELGGNDIDRYIAYNILLPELLKLNNKAAETYNFKQISVIVNQLMGIAERLKIQMCKNFGYLLSDPAALKEVTNDNNQVSIKIPTSIYTDEGDLKQDTFYLSYSEFLKTMHVFFDHNIYSDGATVIEGQEKYNSINTTLDSAIKKANISKTDINYVMMIGGSSKNPFVQNAVQHYFGKQTKMLIPQNLQALVSQGAAIHSLLINGMNIALLRPITSEPIVVVTREAKPSVLIPAGTEIPFAPIKVKGFTTGDNVMNCIEIPICVSDKNKVLSNLKITNSDGSSFQKNEQIILTIEMTADKLLKVTANCNGVECSTDCENPFANTYLTDKERKILEAERNSYISADKNKGIPSKDSLINLRKAYEKADKDLLAAETYEEQIKYYPQENLYNYIGVLFHNAGNYPKAMKNFRLSIEYTPDEHWAYSNLGHDLFIIGEYKEAEQLLQKAVDMAPDCSTALIVLGRLNKEQNNKENAKSFFERAYNILLREWHDNKLDEVDYGWLESVAKELKQNDIAVKVRDSRPDKDCGEVYNQGNLISTKRREEE